MGAFRWISSGTIPNGRDLRQHGWRLAATGERPVGCVSIVDAGGIASGELVRILVNARHEARRLMLISGANTADHRARALSEGFGDAIGDDVSLVELNARAARLAMHGDWVPRSRVIASLELDLMTRDARYQGRAVGLGPREFAMLWRLADTPEETVSKQMLLDDIWRLGFVPESNSIAVQISRMRGKLAAVGLAGLIETAAGGYRLRRAALEFAFEGLRQAS